MQAERAFLAVVRHRLPALHAPDPRLGHEEQGIGPDRKLNRALDGALRLLKRECVDDRRFGVLRSKGVDADTVLLRHALHERNAQGQKEEGSQQTQQDGKRQQLVVLVLEAGD